MRRKEVGGLVSCLLFKKNKIVFQMKILDDDERYISRNISFLETNYLKLDLHIF